MTSQQFSHDASLKLSCHPAIYLTWRPDLPCLNWKILIVVSSDIADWPLKKRIKTVTQLSSPAPDLNSEWCLFVTIKSNPRTRCWFERLTPITWTQTVILNLSKIWLDLSKIWLDFSQIMTVCVYVIGVKRSTQQRVLGLDLMVTNRHHSESKSGRGRRVE